MTGRGLGWLGLVVVGVAGSLAVSDRIYIPFLIVWALGLHWYLERRGARP